MAVSWLPTDDFLIVAEEEGCCDPSTDIDAEDRHTIVEEYSANGSLSSHAAVGGCSEVVEAAMSSGAAHMVGYFVEPTLINDELYSPSDWTTFVTPVWNSTSDWVATSRVLPIQGISKTSVIGIALLSVKGTLSWPAGGDGTRRKAGYPMGVLVGFDGQSEIFGGAGLELVTMGSHWSICQSGDGLHVTSDVPAGLAVQFGPMESSPKGSGDETVELVFHGLEPHQVRRVSTDGGRCHGARVVGDGEGRVLAVTCDAGHVSLTWDGGLDLGSRGIVIDVETSASVP